jgi:hypothetical protein
VFSHVYDVPSFVLLLHANYTPTRAHLLLIKPLHQEFFGVFPFSSKTMHDPIFSQGFLGNQGFSTKTRIKLVFVLIDEFCKFK